MSMNFFRSKRNSTITIVIFGAIILTFIFWGGQKADRTNLTSLTEVNGEDIPYSEFQNRLSQELKMFGQYMNGGKLGDTLVQMIERKVAAGLVMQKALAQKASSMGIRIGDDEILEILQKEKAFHDPKLDRFSPTRYQDVLQLNNLKPAEFEAGIREQLLIERLRGIVEDSISISNVEVQDAFRIEKTEFTLDSATFDGLKLIESKKLSVSDKTISEQYEKFKSEYMSSEKRLADVAVLDTTELAEKISVADADIEKWFEEHGKPGKQPGLMNGVNVHALHILVSDTSARGESKAKELMKGIHSEADFRRVARSSSEDYSNASQGGELGYFGKEMMVKPFSEAAFGKTDLNKIIGPVKTNFGYHLIWVLDRTPAEVTAKARASQIKFLIRQERATNQLANLREEIKKVVEGQGDVASALKARGFEFSQTRPFDSKTRLTNLPFVILEEAMRAPRDKWQGPQESGKSLYVYKITNAIAPQPLTIEEARPQIVKSLEASLTEKLVKDLNIRLLEKKATWEDLQKAGAEIKTTKNFKPFQSTQIPNFSESDVLMKIVQELRPSASISSPVINEGKWVFFRASQWSTLPTAFAEADIQRLRTDILSKKRTHVFDQFTQNILKAAKIPDDFRKKYNI
jgi:peptidyl-prolyl cis-trans isomerase D